MSDNITETEERSPDQIADLLEQSADWLEQNGWTKNSYIRQEYVRDAAGNILLENNGMEYKMRPVSACAVGAMRIVAGAKVTSAGSARPRKTDPRGADVALYEASVNEMSKCVKEWGDLDDEYRAPDVSGEDVIPFWNDRIERTGSQVIEMFRRCAQRVRAGREVAPKGDSDAD